jgi:hypothetical protein
VGTFHSDKGELHGITVVVETTGPRVYVGRCDTQTAEGIFLLDADHHDEGEDGKTNAQYLETAARYGIFPKHPHGLVPAPQITTVTPLGRFNPFGRQAT